MTSDILWLTGHVSAIGQLLVDRRGEDPGPSKGEMSFSFFTPTPFTHRILNARI